MNTFIASGDLNMRRTLSFMLLLAVPVLTLGGCAVAPGASASTLPPAPVPECRDVDATVVLDGTTQHLPTRVCRNGSGPWQMMGDDADAGANADDDTEFNASADAGYGPPGAFYTYDPWFWGYPFGFSSVVVFGHSGHFHGHGGHGFHGNGGGHGFHGGGGHHR
jgi:hypothetical protein